MKIKEYYRGKRVLITGTTGFLGKVVLEKLLWETVDIGKVILLLRPGKGKELSCQEAKSRFLSDILSSKIFDRLRKREDNFMTFINDKIDFFPCDLFQEDIGISGQHQTKIFNGLDAVIHVAAQVSWDERLDFSIRVNALATRRLLEYAKAVTPHPRFIYISSAYVNGHRSGKIMERPFDPNQSIANELGKQVPFSVQDEIDRVLAFAKTIEAESYEKKQLQKFKKEANHQIGIRDDITHSVETQVELLRKKFIHNKLSDYGTKQANLHGWTDSYTLSKAMAEMLLIKHRGDVPLSIIRPPGITSAVKDPVPGWLEGFHLVEPLIVGMGKGLIKAFPGAEKTLIDTVPVDQVVSLIVSACAKLENDAEPQVYQIGTSHTNPITLSAISKIWRSYFKNSPMKTDKGKPVQVGPIKFYPTTETFIQKINWKYIYPLSLAETILMWFRLATVAKPYRKMIGWVSKSKKRAERVCRFSDLYSAYTMNSWIFRSDNTMDLYKRLSDSDRQSFDFDTSKIDWTRYWHETHIPGMKKYVLKN